MEVARDGPAHVLDERVRDSHAAQTRHLVHPKESTLADSGLRKRLRYDC
jgi:hypothetical protein